MTKAAAPTPSGSAPLDRESTLGRRGLLRGGVVLAGAAAASTVIRADPAQAADGDPVRAGQDNAASSSTTLTVGGAGGTSAPTLALNNADGPSLSLQALPAAWPGTLNVGEIAGSELGPIVGVDTVSGTTTTYLATGVDLANLPTPFPTQPSRILDLRSAAGRNNIIRMSSSSALASDGKLGAGEWIDIAVLPTGDDYTLTAVFGNLTVVKPVGWGWACVFAPGVQPPTSSLNYATGQSVANGTFVAVGNVLGTYAVRLFTRTEAWYIFDVTGGVASGAVQAPLAQTAAVRAAGGRTAVVRKLQAALGRQSR